MKKSATFKRISIAEASCHNTEVRGELRETAGACNNAVNSFLGLYDWADKNGLIASNPATGISRA
ncbi:hypothetical protein ACJKIH_24490 [Brucella pseudogrignonensis]|uniref:hypothetical protein n=1 Tax=Brucella pseudogrignonensis TaxID=419475 RepID=UPI0038B4FAF8